MALSFGSTAIERTTGHLWNQHRQNGVARRMIRSRGRRRSNDLAPDSRHKKHIALASPLPDRFVDRRAARRPARARRKSLVSSGGPNWHRRLSSLVRESTLPRIAANGIELHYEEAGDPADPAVLLIMGLGTQLIAWPEDFVQGIAKAGYRVILFDNRDIGLSTQLDGAPATSLVWAMLATKLGIRYRLAYTLNDMAADAVGLLDALGIARAHVVGASMGGMIAQAVAAGWPDRVLSLTSIMSSSGAPGLPGPTPELRKRMMTKRDPNPTREAAVAAGAEMLEAISYADPAREPGAFRDMAGKAFDRNYYPIGAQRQLLAILADRKRYERIAGITAPTLVIHGGADPLVPLANGEDSARRIPGAKLEVIPEMAHDLPPSQTRRMVDLIVTHAKG
jgi:pimeloyl-ACP methyl ester carboxylesterase